MREGAREAFSSPRSFVLASVGSAVGIGNLWRFPYVVGTEGGGAFLIPYLAAIVLCGLPLMILEFTVGRHYRSSVVPVFAAIRQAVRGLGFVPVVVVTMILAYYLVITGWVLAYFFAFAAGAPPPFTAFTDSYLPLAFFLLAAAACFLVVRSGVRRGIERLSTVLMPVMLALLLVLMVTALTMPGAAAGVAFYLSPDFSRLTEASVWTAAFGQAFFSLSVGSGIMLTYGSYATPGSLVKFATMITSADVLVAFVGGLVIFPVVFSFGFDPASGVQLAFVTLPRIFETMPLGFVFGAVFFFVLAVAALTSAVSILEVPVATLIDAWGIARPRAVVLVTGAVLGLGLPSALSYTPLRLRLAGIPVLDLNDLVFGTVGMIVAGLVLSLVAGWLAPAALVGGALGEGRGRRRVFLFLVRVLIPGALLATLAARALGPLGRS